MQACICQTLSVAVSLQQPCIHIFPLMHIIIWAPNRYCTNLYSILCRYVQYYADILQQPDLAAKKMHLQKVIVSGLPADELKDLVLGVWSRPLGAGWKTELLCLASVQSHGSPVQGRPFLSHLCKQSKPGKLHCFKRSIPSKTMHVLEL